MADPIPMSPPMSRREALAEVESQSDGALTMRELPCATQITLRVAPGSAAGVAAATAIGGALPAEPNTVCSHGPLDVLWMGPDEWLLLSQELSADQLQRLLRPARGAATAVVDSARSARSSSSAVRPPARSCRVAASSIFTSRAWGSGAAHRLCWRGPR